MPQYDLAGNLMPENKPAVAPDFGITLMPTGAPAYAPKGPSPPPERAEFDLSGNALPAAPVSTINKAGETRSQEEESNARARANTSGRLSSVPPEIEGFKWSWGAFGLSWLWCLNHKMAGWGIGLLVLAFVPGLNFIGLFLAIYLGLMGNKLGWQNRRYEGGVPQFLQVETAWKNWGIAAVVLGIVLIPVDAALLFPLVKQAQKALQGH